MNPLMGLDLRMHQKMSQQLVMTPQLQQAIKLLQLSHLEMAEALREEMEQNPVLEEESDDDHEPPSDEPEVEAAAGEDYDEPAIDATPEPTAAEVDQEFDWDSYFESVAMPSGSAQSLGEELPPIETSAATTTSLHEHLVWQLQVSTFTPEQKQIGLLLIDAINDDGYLPEDAVQSVCEALGVSPKAVEEVLGDLQEFDPVGVAARNMQECLLLQARYLNTENPLVFAIIDHYLPWVERHNLQALAKECKKPLEEVHEAVKIITQLEPRPGRTFTDRIPQYITPDVFIYKVGDEYVISLNDDGLPRLRISNYYREALRTPGDAKAYIQEKLRSAAWLIRSIHMRQRTIYKVMESILEFQREFFDFGPAHLKPLILKDVADHVGMHESTISRVTSNKYVHTSQGLFELKYFFNSGIGRVTGDDISSESVREHIKQLVDAEDRKNPLSDQHIVELLFKLRKIKIARRTVAKYREMMKIAPSSQRKLMF
jgi:RNA polymerase sigma-54 factor